MKLGIFLPNWVGDVVMSTPTLRALRTHFGAEGYLAGVMRPSVADVLAGTDLLDERILYDPRSDRRELHERTLVRRLRAAQLDAIVLLTNSFRTAWYAWRSRTPRRIGYARGGRSLLLTDRLAPQKRHSRFVPTPALDTYLELAYHLGCTLESPQLELATTLQDEAAADELWRQLQIRPHEPVVIFNPGGAFGPGKQWPTEYFSDLAARLVDSHRVHVVVLCGPSERELAREIAGRAQREKVHSLAEAKLSLGLSKACVRRARLMVTTDSGPRHFAAAFDVPVVTLFGPTHIAWSETHYPRAVHLQLDVDCGPCQKRSCPLGHHRCMRDLSVERVYNTAVDLFARVEEGRAA